MERRSPGVERMYPQSEGRIGIFVAVLPGTVPLRRRIGPKRAQRRCRSRCYGLQKLEASSENANVYARLLPTPVRC